MTISLSLLSRIAVIKITMPVSNTSSSITVFLTWFQNYLKSFKSICEENLGTEFDDSTC